MYTGPRGTTWYSASISVTAISFQIPLKSYYKLPYTR